MARTNAADVKELFDTDLADATVTSWIEIATEVVDDIADKDSSISSTRLTKIEKLLAAHYAASQDPRIESTSRETASVSYQRNDEYATEYLAAAASLDPTGIVTTLNKPNASVQSVDVKGLSSDSY